MYKYKLLTEQNIIGWHKENIALEENKYFAELVSVFGNLVYEVCG
jgi:hypothetical protein